MALTGNVVAASAGQLRGSFRDISGTIRMTAGADPSQTLVAARTKHTHFIQKILVQISTSAAQTLRFEDDAGTPIVVAEVPAGSGEGIIEFDFGDVGVPLTEGQVFRLVASAAGYVGTIIWEGYSKPTSTMVPSQM